MRYNYLMLQKPMLMKNFLTENTLSLFQAWADEIKRRETKDPKENLFNRISYHNDAKFAFFHREVITPMISKISGQILKPSYNFLSCYLPGIGECPIHVDRPQCYMTVDICLNQLRPWPLYVNSSKNFNRNGIDIFFENDLKEREQIKRESEEFLMEPGDALIYSGTNHAHWRKRIDEDNFCDLVFFHFVPQDFQGTLD